MNDNKEYFLPGDLVTVKADILHKPIMVVKGREIIYLKESGINHLKGIKCWWFSTNMEIQYGTFSTKDLMKYIPPAINNIPGFPFLSPTISPFKYPIGPGPEPFTYPTPWREAPIITYSNESQTPLDTQIN